MTRPRRWIDHDGYVPVHFQVVDQLEDAVNTSDVTAWDPVWALVTVVVGVLLSRLVRAGVRRVGRRAELAPNVVDLLGTTAMWMVISIAIVLALTFVGLDVTPLWLFILLVIVVFVVGGRSLLEGFGAGILLQARAPFRPGDVVRLQGFEGTVAEVNSRTVVVDLIDGRRVYLPNTQVLAGSIENLTHHGSLMSTLLLDVVYGTDLAEARDIAVRAMVGLPLVYEDPPPVADVTGFEASSVRLRLRFWHDAGIVSGWEAVDAAARAVYAGYAERGIAFAFPQATLWWGDRPSAEATGEDGGPPPFPAAT